MDNHSSLDTPLKISFGFRIVLIKVFTILILIIQTSAFSVTNVNEATIKAIYNIIDQSDLLLGKCRDEISCAEQDYNAINYNQPQIRKSLSAITIALNSLKDYKDYISENLDTYFKNGDVVYSGLFQTPIKYYRSDYLTHLTSYNQELINALVLHLKTLNFTVLDERSLEFRRFWDNNLPTITNSARLRNLFLTTTNDFQQDLNKLSAVSNYFNSLPDSNTGPQDWGTAYQSLSNSRALLAGVELKFVPYLSSAFAKLSNQELTVKNLYLKNHKSDYERKVSLSNEIQQLSSKLRMIEAQEENDYFYFSGKTTSVTPTLSENPEAIQIWGVAYTKNGRSIGSGQDKVNIVILKPRHYAGYPNWTRFGGEVVLPSKYVSTGTGKNSFGQDVPIYYFTPGDENTESTKITEKIDALNSQLKSLTIRLIY